MSKTIVFILLFLVSGLLYISQSGCKGDSVTEPGTNNSGVTFSMAQQINQQGNTEFLAKSNVNIKIDSVISKLAAQNFSYTTVNQDPAVIFNANEDFIIDEFTGIQSGQKWTFSFYGKRADNGNKYIVTSDYTIPN